MRDRNFACCKSGLNHCRRTLSVEITNFIFCTCIYLGKIEISAEKILKRFGNLKRELRIAFLRFETSGRCLHEVAERIPLQSHRCHDERESVVIARSIEKSVVELRLDVISRELPNAFRPRDDTRFYESPLLFVT